MSADSATPRYTFAMPTPLPLEAAFDGGRLTSDGGPPWLAEADAALGLCAAFAALVPQWRRGRVQHPLETLVRQRVFQLACGDADQEGVAALTKRSSAVHTAQAAFAPAAAEQLRALRHRSPRDFGYKTRLWTLELAAEEAHRQGLTAARVTGETVRATLARLGVRWLRAKTWITSPDPAYARGKGGATA